MRFLSAISVFLVCGALIVASTAAGTSPTTVGKPPVTEGVVPKAGPSVADSGVLPGSDHRLHHWPPTGGIAPWAGGNVSAEMPADVEQRASCVVQVDSPGHHLVGVVSRTGPSLDGTTAAWLLSSTKLSEPAVSTALKRGQVGRDVIIAAVPSGNRFVRVEVTLKKTGKTWPKGAADELMTKLIDRLRSAAKESQEAELAAYATRLAVLKDRLAASKKRSDEIAESLRSVRDALLQGGDYYGDPTNTIRNLRMQKRQIESELTRLKSRMAALEDQSILELETKVKSAEKALAKLTRAAKGDHANAEAISEAATVLADAKEKLAVARAQLASSGNNAFYRLRERNNLQLNISEQESRLKPIVEQLAKLEAPGMDAKLSTYRERQQEEQRFQSEMSTLSEQVRVLERRVKDRTPTTFTVLAGNAADEKK